MTEYVVLIVGDADDGIEVRRTVHSAERRS